MPSGVGGPIFPFLRVKPAEGSLLVFAGGAWGPVDAQHPVSIADSALLITGSSDQSKGLQFEVDTQGSGFRLTVDVGAQNASRTLLVPVLTGNRTLAVLEQAQTFTAAQAFSSGATCTGANAFTLGLTAQTASADTSAGNFPVVSFYNTDSTNNNGAGFRFTGTASNSVPVSGANLLCKFSGKGVGVLDGTLFFNTSNAGVDGTRMTIGPTGIVSLSCTAAATSTTAAALIVPGGIACGDSIYTAVKFHAVQSDANGVNQFYFQNTQNGTYFTAISLGSTGYGLTDWPNSVLFEANPVSTGNLILGCQTNDIVFQVSSRTTSARLKANGQFLLNIPTGGLGYGTGAGGTVTQITSKATGVTLNKVCGQVTMQAAALAAGAKVSFVVTDSACAATDIPSVAVVSGGTANAYRASVTAVAAGSFTVTVENITAGSLSEAPVIGFSIGKAVTA